MRIRQLIWTLFILIVGLINPIIARPNPVTDDETDNSKEATYKYPDFEKSPHPYWKAWSHEAQHRLKEHDRMESYLNQIRQLDFKLREAWTVNDKPFITN